MTSTANPPISDLEAAAREHLWMHFTRMAAYPPGELPIIARGEGCYVWDTNGHRILDGLSALFCVNIGHGRRDIVEAAVPQADVLGYFSNWSFAHPAAIRLAERVAGLAPDGLNRVFFTSGGSESVESAIKLTRQFHKLTGNPGKYKLIARENAYHGTSLGALMATGIAAFKEPFEPVAPGGCHVPNVRQLREAGVPPEQFAEVFKERIEAEGPETVAAVIVEPVQAAGGCLTAPPGYFQRLREICDEYDVLMISDEVICSWGRLGDWFGAGLYDYRPDIITTAKGLTSGYAPMGAVIAADRVAEPFMRPDAAFLHGFTFGGHPLACAIATANIDVFENEGLIEHVQASEGAFRSSLETLLELPMVRELRGAGFFQALELGRPDGPELSREESAALVGHLIQDVISRGLFCRFDDRAGYPCIVLSPPLIAGEEEFAAITTILHDALVAAADRF